MIDLRALADAVGALPATPFWLTPDPNDGMCPNCNTPWKCNGPHEPAERKPDGFDVDLSAVLRLIEQAAAPDGLDVERLARALVAEIPAVHRWLTVGWKETMDDEAKVLAAKLVAEYRAATPSHPATSETP